MTVASAVVLGVGLYAGVGLSFAALFVWRGVAAIDPAAASTSIGFRLLLIPGSAALWPLLLRRWLSRAQPPEEHNPHRLAAHGREAPR